MALHRQGDIDAAERIYRDILARRSDHFDATHMLGVVLLQRRRTKEGIALIRQAIALNGEAASAHVNLGNALDASGDADGAGCGVSVVVLVVAFELITTFVDEMVIDDGCA